MSCIRIHVTLGTLARTCKLMIWAPGGPMKYHLLDVDDDGVPIVPASIFLTPSTLRLSSVVLIDMTVNDRICIPLYTPFPTAHESHYGLELCEVAVRIRVWSESFAILQDEAVTWDQLCHITNKHSIAAGQRFTVVVDEIDHVGNTGSTMMKSLEMRLRSVLDNQPFNTTRRMCSVSGIPKIKELPCCVSLERTWVYDIHQPAATEAWFIERLEESLHALFDATSSDIVRVLADPGNMDKLLSFMFYQHTLDIASQKHYTCIADCLHQPQSDEDLITIAYHLMMTLLFTEWSKDSALNRLRWEICQLGLPYVAMSQAGNCGLVLIPYGMIPLNYPSTGVFFHDEWLFPSGHMELTHIEPFTQLSLDGLVLTGTGLRWPNQTVPLPNKYVFAYGNAHELLHNASLGRTLLLRDKKGMLDIKLQSPSAAMDDEQWIMKYYGGHIVPVEPYKTRPGVAPLYVAYYPQASIQSKNIKLLYINPRATEKEILVSLERIEQLLEQMNMDMDLVRVHGEWIVRIGIIKHGWL